MTAFPAGGAATAAARSIVPTPAPELSIVIVQPPAAPPAAGYASGVRDALDVLGCAAETIVVAAPGELEAASAAWSGADVSAPDA